MTSYRKENTLIPSHIYVRKFVHKYKNIRLLNKIKYKKIYGDKGNYKARI